MPALSLLLKTIAIQDSMNFFNDTATTEIYTNVQRYLFI